MSNNVALHKPVLETDIRRPTEATDGVVTGYDQSSGYASFRWPGTLTIDLEREYPLKCIRLLLFDGRGRNQYGPLDARRYRYRLLISVDRVTWEAIFETGDSGSVGWQVLEARHAMPARYIRIQGLHNTANAHFHVVEVEAYESTPSYPANAEAILHAAISSTTALATEGTNDSRTTADSLSAFISYVKTNCADGQYLFRGQSEQWPLLPRIARIHPRGNAADVERHMFEDFQHQALPFLETKPDTSWEWLALARHHGLPTRLLDWTANPIAALWFAVREARKLPRPGIVWMFCPSPADHAPTKDSEPFDCTRTLVFRPRPIARRIAVQSAWFTVHKYIAKTNSFVALDKNRAYRKRLRALEIPSIKVPDIRQELDRCGFNSNTMFPGLDGLCEHIERQYGYLSDETPTTTPEITRH